MEAISYVPSAPGSTSFESFLPALDYLPVDAPSTVPGAVHPSVVSRALEVRVDSSRLSGAVTTQFYRNSMHLMTLPSLK